ncbi:monofunctional biosynthetic peptidoglycan transglycosylase [Rhabdaerophilaceae bacterium]
MIRLMGWLGFGVAAMLIASLVLGRFVPVPSTLMIGRWLTGLPIAQQWVPLDEIASTLPAAVVAAEDQRFCAHAGVDFVELKKVLEDEDGPARGASTLTMQVAKNLYLWPGRSFIRKGLEIPLAILIDVAWGKRRVMEVYLNVAEWGDGIFGAEAAARHYFNKPASALSATEAARLASILPNPIVRDASRPSAASRRIADRLASISPYADCVRQRG